MAHPTSPRAGPEPVTLALVGWRLEPIDWLALVVIIWLGVALVVAPFVGEHLARRRRQQTRPHQPEEDDGTPPGYRPPRD